MSLKLFFLNFHSYFSFYFFFSFALYLHILYLFLLLFSIMQERGKTVGLLHDLLSGGRQKYMNLNYEIIYIK